MMPAILKIQEIYETFSKCELSTKMREGSKGKQLRYASWTEVWEQILKLYPSSTYEIIPNKDGNIEHKAGNGSIVMVRLSIENFTHFAWLAVSDQSNRALPYTSVDSRTGEVKEHPIQSTDVANTIMRCLCKAAAMFGLGLYIYAGEDMPEAVRAEIQVKEAEALDNKREEFRKALEAVDSREKFEEIMKKYPDLIRDDRFVDMMKALAKKFPKNPK